MLSVSVIIPVHNGGEAFRKCIETVAQSISDIDEIIVIADGESDGAWRFADHFPVRILVNETSKGPASARNDGARMAGKDILLFVDADVSVRPNTVDLVRNAFDENQEVAALFGSYDDEPADLAFLSQYRNLLHHYTHQHAEESAGTFWCGCGAVRREIFKEAGGFDDTFTTASVEDIEFGYRLTQSGHQIRLRKDIQVKHLKRWNGAAMIRTDVFGRAVPWTELILARRALRNDLNLRIENRLSVLLVYLFPISLLLSILLPAMWIVAAACIAGFVVMNAGFFRLLLRKKGFGFMLKAVPWHAFFYIYSGFGFLLGSWRHLKDTFFNRSEGVRAEEPTSGSGSGDPETDLEAARA